MDYSIETHGLRKVYDNIVAVEGLNLRVERGCFFGFLGPNGAGKSTTMKILTTYLYPSGGSAIVAGVDVLKDPVQVRKKIGYLPEVLPLYMDMEVRTYLDFVGSARGLSGAKLKERVNTVLDVTGLRPMYRKVIRELSKGYKQRTGIAQALIHDPEVVILDEPTSGLDPHQILEIRALISDLAKEKTVILSTHILHEVETTADRIVIINRGQIVGDGTLDELRHKAKDNERTAIAVEGKREVVEPKLKAVGGISHVEFAGEEKGCASFLVYSKAGVSPWRELSQLAQAEQWQVKQLGDKPLSLEETFLTLTEKAAKAAS